jgi:hypothetical protein
MKKLPLVVFLLFLCGGCAARRAKIFLPQVSSPAAEGADVSFQGTPLQISNSSPFFCSLFAGRKNLGVLRPGELIYDLRHWHNLWYQYIPVAAICYRDTQLSSYVGAAGRILALSEYAPAEWTIRSSDIRTPDGRPPRVPTTSTATTRSRKVELPRETLSTVGIQVVNNTTSDIVILINGKPVAALGTGGVDYVRAELVGGYSRPLIITITAGAGCTHTETVWVNKYSQYARQILFDAGLCGWSRWR